MHSWHRIRGEEGRQQHMDKCEGMPVLCVCVMGRGR